MPYRVNLGTAGPDLHFGARIGDRYLDPTTLLGPGGPPEVHLVPDEAVPEVADDRAALAEMMAESTPAGGARFTDAPPDRARSDVGEALDRLVSAWR